MAAKKEIFYVTKNDLPLSCPLGGQDVKSMHPKVYLPIEKSKHEICPYCSAEYVLEETSR